MGRFTHESACVMCARVRVYALLLVLLANNISNISK